MINIIFITGNSKKVESAQAVLNEFNIKILQLKLETPEIQDKDICKVAEYSAKFASDKLHKNVIKVDVGFEIESLNGFPGPFSKFINEWLSPNQILKIIGDESNRKAKFIDVVSYCELNKKPISFFAETNGTIARKPLGDNGWGLDKIFIPQGCKTTLANLSNEERIKVWNTDHWIKLAQYLTK